MKYLWEFLLLLLCPRVDDEPVNDEVVDDEVVDDEVVDDEVVDDEVVDDEVVDDKPVKPESRAQKEIRTLRERAQASEEQHRKAMAELEAARRQPTQPLQPTQEQVIWEQEEKVLRDPNADDWQKYAVKSARDSRLANQNSQNALRQAEDIADRAEFNALKAEKPKMHEQYKDRVEERLAELRKNGQNAPRKNILAFLVGEDMVAGKLKTTEKPAKPKGGAERGSTPGARSNVNSSSGRLSESEKRAKRLENVRI